MKFIEQYIELEKLLLDPNNFRFQDIDDFVYADEARFHENSVQTRAYNRMKQSEGLTALKGSIIRNTYIPSEKIVVKKYSDDPERYLVLEGNRRISAAKWILEDNAAGVAVEPNVLSSIQTVPTVIVDGDDKEAKIVQASLMGIRHVSGIKQWGGYQRAKLVISMRDDHELLSNEVAERLAMTAREVNRRYRAFKSLTQYQEDEEFGEYFRPGLYPLFHEALSIPLIREWLGWNDEINIFENVEEVEKFFRSISPETIEEEDGTTIQHEAKITTYSQIRQLRSILPNDDAKTALFDEPDQTYDDALAIAKQPEIARHWARTIGSASRALNDMSVAVLKDISDEDLKQLNSLKDLIDERLNDIVQLKN